LRVDDSLKELMHNEQLWGFSPEWTSDSSDHFAEQRTSHTDDKEKVSLQKNQAFNTMGDFNMM
jgi:hypothetical protein